MTFEDAIKEMETASKIFKQAIVAVGVAAGKAIAEKQKSPERKIDGAAFTDWVQSYNVVYDKNGFDVNAQNEYTMERKDLIYHAPGTMGDVITLVKQWDSTPNMFPMSVPIWLDKAIDRLRQRIIDAGFGCDLQ